MMGFCANCISPRGPFSVDRDGFTWCVRCQTEPIVERHGPQRGYESSGGLPTPEEVDRGYRRVMGDAEFDRLTALDETVSRTPRRARR